MCTVQERTGSKVKAMPATLDHSSHEEFLTYYADKSILPDQLQHFRSVRNAILRVLGKGNQPDVKYDVLDIGCNAGGQCSIWTEDYHQVHGLDVNAPLLELAKKRAAEAGQKIDYRLGTATDLPWPDQSMDICIALELLEHVADWQGCLQEFTRVLRPGGALFFSTTNALCPFQHEFNLLGYAWYPAPLKHYFERLAFTTRPELANHAKYPAVNWFNPYGLRAELARRGFSSLDRFDLVDTASKGSLAKLIVGLIRAVPPLRLLAHVCTPSTTVLGIKR
jgi:2-polyprenyl-3-methyl-5-hydroxy-6-metoxy-1,4-benzoquinol methylase